MSRVITFSRFFPAYHPRKGEPTFFVEKIWKGLGGVQTEYANNFIEEDFKKSIVWNFQMVDGIKHHTIRAGNRWKVGDWFSPRVWSGKPYNSKQIVIAPDIQVKKVFDLTFQYISRPFVTFENEKGYDESYPEGTFQKMAINDGFTNREDLEHWLLGGKGNSPVFHGQIICWNENIDY